MSIKLDWHEGDEHPEVVWEGDPEPLPVASAPAQTIVQGDQAHPQRASRFLRWAVIAVSALVAVGAIAGGVLLWQVNQGNERAQADLELAAEQILTAQRDSDEQFLSNLLDPLDSVWNARMLQTLLGTPGVPIPTAVRVVDVELGLSTAAAEIVETWAGGNTVRKLVFFRRDGNDNQWLLTPPRPDAFGEQATLESPHFRVHFRARDEPFVSSLINVAEGAYVALCGDLRCRPHNRLLELQILYESGSLAEQRWGDIVVASPWVQGIGQDGQPITGFDASVVQQIAQSIAEEKAPSAPPALLQVIGDWAAEDLGTPSAQEARDASVTQPDGSLLPLADAWQEVVARGEGFGGVASSHREQAAAQVRSLLSFLSENAGADAVGRLLEELNHSDRLEVILAKAFRAELSTVEQGWLGWLQAQRLPPTGTTSG